MPHKQFTLLPLAKSRGCSRHVANKLSRHKLTHRQFLPFLLWQHGHCIHSPVFLEWRNMLIVNTISKVMLAACKSCIGLLLCMCGFSCIKLAFGRGRITLGLAAWNQLCISASQASIICIPSRACLECWSLECSICSIDWENN